MDINVVYGYKTIRPDVHAVIDPPSPLTARQRIEIIVHRSLEVAILSLFGAGLVVVAPVQTITAFVVSFTIVILAGITRR